MFQKLSFCINELFGGWHKAQDKTFYVLFLPDSILLGFGDAVAAGRCVVVEVGVGVVNDVVGVGSGIERLQLGPCSSSSMTFSAQAVRNIHKLRFMVCCGYSIVSPVH